MVFRKFLFIPRTKQSLQTQSVGKIFSNPVVKQVVHTVTTMF